MGYGQNSRYHCEDIVIFWIFYTADFTSACFIPEVANYNLTEFPSEMRTSGTEIMEEEFSLTGTARVEDVSVAEAADLSAWQVDGVKSIGWMTWRYPMPRIIWIEKQSKAKDAHTLPCRERTTTASTPKGAWLK